MGKPRIRKLDEERLRTLTFQIQQTPAFKAVAAAYDRAMLERRKAVLDKYESHPDVQRWRSMTKAEQAKDAIDRMTKVRKEMNDLRAGTDTTEDEARRYAQGLAEKSDKQKQ
jgi:hypothetical protein